MNKNYVAQVNEEIGDWAAEVFKPSINKTLENITPQDYMVEKRILGLAFRDTNIKILDVGHARVTNYIWKD